MSVTTSNIPTSGAYTTYYQGVKVTSNIPTSTAQPGTYTYTIYWSDNALGWIEDKASEGFSLLNQYNGDIITKFMEEELKINPSVNLSNLSFTANNQYAQISFTTHTISVFTTVGIIVGVIIWAIALATSFIPGVDLISVGSAILYTFLDAIGVATLNWFINGIDAIYEPIAQAVGPVLGSSATFVIIGLVAIVIGSIGYVAYKKVKGIGGK